jgi:Fe-S cluster assembly protein SufD
MEYILDNILNLEIDKDSEIKLVISNSEVEVNIVVKSNVNLKIIEHYNVNKNINYKLNIKILDNSTVTYNTYNTHKYNINLDMNVDISNNGYLNSYIGMFGSNTNNRYVVNLNEENSKVDFNVMTYNDNKSLQEHNISVNHLSNHTTSNIYHYGVLNGESNSKFDVRSYIKNGCNNSNANQKSRVMCLDDKSNATILPILSIEEYDVNASHAATVTKIDERDLYYIESRGIDRNTAYAMIAVGFLLKNVSNELKEELEKVIEVRINE